MYSPACNISATQYRVLLIDTRRPLKAKETGAFILTADNGEVT